MQFDQTPLSTVLSQFPLLKRKKKIKACPYSVSLISPVPNRRSTLHTLQKARQIKLIFILLLIPQFTNLIQKTLLPFILHRTHRINRVCMRDLIDVIGTARHRRHIAGGRARNVEEVEQLIRFHGAEAGVLLVYDGGGDIDFEALETVGCNESAHDRLCQGKEGRKEGV
jgi:hypothetical protein